MSNGFPVTSATMPAGDSANNYRHAQKATASTSTNTRGALTVQVSSRDKNPSSPNGDSSAVKTSGSLPQTLNVMDYLVSDPGYG